MKNKTKILEGWRETNLCEVIKIRKGLTYKSLDYGDETEGLIFINLKCIAKGGGFNNAGVKYYKGKYSEEDLVNGGDLIIANTDLTRAGDVIGAPLFVPNITNKKMLMSMDVSALDIDKNLTNKKFIYYYLSQYRVRQYMRNISSGSTVLHLKVQEIPKFKILLPPLAIQNKIAEILGAVDEEIEKVDSVIEKSEKVRNCLVKKLFADNKDKQVKIFDICEVKGGKRLPKGELLFEEKTEHPYIRIVDFKDGGIDQRNLKYLSDSIFDKIKRYIISKDDIYISIAGTIGMVGLIPEKLDSANLTENAAKLVIKNKKVVTKEFVYYFLNSNLGQTQIKDLTVKTSQPKLALNKIESIKLFLPSLEEQNNIVDILSTFDNKILIYNKIKNSLIQLKKGLMADLLSGEKALI